MFPELKPHLGFNPGNYFITTFVTFVTCKDWTQIKETNTTKHGKLAHETKHSVNHAVDTVLCRLCFRPAAH